MSSQLYPAGTRQPATKVGAGETSASASAVRVLKGIAQDAGHPDHAFAMDLIDKRFKGLEKNTFGKSIVSNRDNRSNIQAIREQQRKAVQSVAPTPNWVPARRRNG